MARSAHQPRIKLVEGQRDLVAVGATALLALCLVFGGASQGNALQLAGLELAALPVLFLAGHRLWQSGAYGHMRVTLALAGSVVAIPLLQLAPLPYDLWSRLPGRQDVVTATALLGTQPWLPISLTPEATWRAALALLPPLAIFIATLVSRPSARRGMVVVILVAALLSALIGALQLASGGARALYPYEVTNVGSAVGLFANRNHLATLLLVSLPLAGALVGAAFRTRTGDRRLQVAVTILFVLIALVAIAATRSRAGVLLAGPALVGALLVAWRSSGEGGRKGGLAALGLVGATAFAAIGAFGLSPILDRFDQGASAEVRFQVWPTIASTAEAYLPTGSGIGSFESVYQSVEPLETLDGSFLNHAHNDYLEVWLEAGWPGVIGLALFCLWWASRTYHVWGRADSALGLERGASCVIGLVLLHSLGDYPLRTEAVATVLALACATLAAPTPPSTLGARGA